MKNNSPGNGATISTNFGHIFSLKYCLNLFMLLPRDPINWHDDRDVSAVPPHHLT